MAKYALVKDGIVENIIELEANSTWQPPEGIELIESGADARVGGAYVNGCFILPVQTTENSWGGDLKNQP